MKWAKNEWCFFEFKLCQIQEVEEGRVTSVSDGSFNTSGRSLGDRCVPLTLRFANLSDRADYWSSQWHRRCRVPPILYPTYRPAHILSSWRHARCTRLFVGVGASRRVALLPRLVLFW